MTMTPRSLETLIDLVEIKLSCMVEILDKNDAREVANLEQCLGELNVLAGRKAKGQQQVVNFSRCGRGRPHAAEAADKKATEKAAAE
jgi:hypothetical protein